MELTAFLRFRKLLRRTIPRIREHGKIAGWPLPASQKDSHQQRPTSALSMKAISLTLLILASGMTVQGKLVTKTVSYEQNGTKLEGYLAYDDSFTDKGKVPGVSFFPNGGD